MTLREWFQAQQGKERRYLTLFSIGATLFFSGAGVMLFAEHRITPSIGQELVTLGGLLLSISGTLLAATGYIMLTLIRLFRTPNAND